MLPHPRISRVGRTASEAVVEEFQNWIRTQALPPGHRLPTLRLLAAHFEIDKNTAMRACGILVDRGVLRRVGSGKHVHLKVPDATVAPLADTILLISSLPPGQLCRPSAPGRAIRIVVGVLAGLNEAGRDTLLTHPATVSKERFDAWRAGGLGGIVITEPLNAVGCAGVAALQRAGTAVVIYGDALTMSGADSVCSDHHLGGDVTVRHLASRGYRRLLPTMPAGIPSAPWVEGRRHGWRDACRELGLAELPEISLPCQQTSDPGTFTQHVRVVVGVLAETITGPYPPDAILTVNDGHAVVVKAACALLHRPMIAIAGYDNLWADLHDHERAQGQPDCSIDKCNETIGRALARLVLERRANRGDKEAKTLIILPQLVLPT